jgi:hypothetical protein
VVGALWRNVVQQFFGQIAMGVNDPDSMPKRYVLDDQIAQKGGFAGASFSDDVDMLALVTGGYAKRPWVAPAFALADDDVWLVRFQNQSPLLSTLKVFKLSDFRCRGIDLFAGRSVLGHAGEVIATGVEIRMGA